MKVEIQCAHCLLERALNQAKLATNDQDLQMQVLTAMLKFLGENLNEDSVPSHIGTDRDLIVQRMTGKDPYEQLKKESNLMALSILPELTSLVEEEETSELRFRKAALIAAAANAIEFDVSGRDFSLDELRDIISRVDSDLAIDEVSTFRELCKGANTVLYLMDNAGEVVLDMILISEIKRLGPKVIAVVKGGPILNDATMVDSDEVGLSEYVDEVIDTGAPAIGVNLERDSDEFKKILYSSELIVAKGMGNYESMTEFELPSPVVHIMRTKCLPVAKHVGVPRNKNIVLIRRPTAH
ncbi:MAG: ARMT1-like domain-containing protein [Candidatus Thorarchaeota archaeon]